ncbi:MAG TPA: hypothetical protein P5136_01605 [Methanofastidiosum sp.]|nr:hypothetical protein [Methanofastidiosum sp.]
MPARKPEQILTYEKCDELLQGKCYLRKRLENNTYLERDTFTFKLWLYDTPIMTISKERWTLTNGGHRTDTTRRRLEQFSPLCIYQRDFIWYYYFKGEPFESASRWHNPVVIHSLDYFEHMLKTLPKS